MGLEKGILARYQFFVGHDYHHHVGDYDGGR